MKALMLSLAFSAIIAPAASSDGQFDEYLETRIRLAQDIQQHFWPELNQQLGPDGFSIVHEFYGAHSAWGSSLWKFTREGDAWSVAYRIVELPTNSAEALRENSICSVGETALTAPEARLAVSLSKLDMRDQKLPQEEYVLDDEGALLTKSEDGAALSTFFPDTSWVIFDDTHPADFGMTSAFSYDLQKLLASISKRISTDEFSCANSRPYPPMAAIGKYFRLRTNSNSQE